MRDQMESLVETIKKIELTKSISELDEVERLSLKNKFYPLTTGETLKVIKNYPSYIEFVDPYHMNIIKKIDYFTSTPEEAHLELVKKDNILIKLRDCWQINVRLIKSFNIFIARKIVDVFKLFKANK